MNYGLFKMLPTNYSFIKHTYLIYICINRIWHEVTYKGWYAIKTNQPKQAFTIIKQNPCIGGDMDCYLSWAIMKIIFIRRRVYVCVEVRVGGLENCQYAKWIQQVAFEFQPRLFYVPFPLLLLEKAWIHFPLKSETSYHRHYIKFDVWISEYLAKHNYT